MPAVGADGKPMFPTGRPNGATSAQPRGVQNPTPRLVEAPGTGPLPWDQPNITAPSPELVTRPPVSAKPNLNLSGISAARGVVGTIRQQARLNGVPEALALAVAKQESGFQQEAVSPAGAVGIMQLMPGTAQGLNVDPYNWKQNIAGGMRYLKMQYDAFGNWKLALAAYNAGPGAVKDGSWKGISETTNYVRSVGAIAKQIAGGQYAPAGGSTGLIQVSAPLPGHPTVTSGFGPRGQGALGVSEKLPGGQAAFLNAKTQLGQPYVWGGESRGSGGFDCSGLVQWSFHQIGIDMPRVAADQYKMGTPVARGQGMRPGDLVFLEPGPSGPGHVVIYAGHGDVIAAPHTGTDVQIQKLNDVIRMDGFVGIRRIVQQGKASQSTPGGDFHAGVDLAAPIGTPVHAMIGGRVVFSGWTKGGGNTLTIQDKGGRLWNYFHMQEAPTLQRGAAITAGGQIGRVGATGQATGPHLDIHLMVKGRWANPMAVVNKAFRAGWGKKATISLSATDFLAPGSGGVNGTGGAAGGGGSPQGLFVSGVSGSDTQVPQGVDAAVTPGGQTAIPSNTAAWQRIVSSGPVSPETKNLAARAGAMTQDSPALSEVYSNPGGGG